MGGESSQVESSMGVLSSMEEFSTCASLSQSSDTTFPCLLTIIVKVLSPNKVRHKEAAKAFALHRGAQKHACNEQGLCLMLGVTTWWCCTQLLHSSF